MNSRNEPMAIIDINGMKLSRLIWWLADLAIPCLEPKVGDWVVEITHVIGMKSAQVGRLDAVGKMIKIEELTEPSLLGGKKYTILTLEGKEVTWTNAMFGKLD